MAMNNDGKRSYVAWRDGKGNHVLWFKCGARGILPTRSDRGLDEQVYDWGNISNATRRLARALIANLYDDDEELRNDTEYFFAKEFLMFFPDEWGIHENIMRRMIEAADIIAGVAHS